MDYIPLPYLRDAMRLANAHVQNVAKLVKATENLAEQQRISNLIALTDAVHENLSLSARSALSHLDQDEDGEWSRRFRPNVADALGIEVQS